MFCIITFDLYSFGKMNNMTEQPLLTIAIPTYNGSATIRVMMDILMPQCDSRVEIIVSDNCSMDTTPEIIKYYKEKYPFIKYVRNQINIGADANFLQCMRLATGKYIYLLSDDDVLMEGALSYILDYLARYPDVGLVYLNSMGFHGRYEGLERCSKLAYAEEPKEDLYTEDKTLFMNCAARFWGFMSSFIVLNKNFKKIEKPEQYFGTYWLQSYIHILCCSAPHSKVGVIKKPCMAAGIYMDVNNFDNSIVNGVNYKAMVDFAVNIGGFELNITYHDENIEIEFPQINCVYTHMLGHDCHSIVAGENHANAIIEQLKGYKEKGYNLILSSHYTPETLTDVDTKIAYLENIKKIAIESKNINEFKEEVKKEYPNYSGLNYLDMTASYFFPQN